MCYTHWDQQYQKKIKLRPIGKFGERVGESQPLIEETEEPVPEWPWGSHGWAPNELGWMREAAQLPEHPREPLSRANMRAWMKRSPSEFNLAMLKLEAELRAKIDKAEADEAAAAKAAEPATKESEQEAVAFDLGAERVRDLGMKLLAEWQTTKQPLPYAGAGQGRASG